MVQPMESQSRQEPAGVIEVTSPATLEKIGEVAVDSPAEVAVAAARAREAARMWAALPLAERAAALLGARDAFVDHREELIGLLCHENGKPRLEALTELAYVGDMLTFYGKRGRKFLAPEHIRPHMMLNKRVTVHYHPRGVV
ncbi:MAG: aldehyde dehydrogenase family protein, partial [Acidobacteria bacterium]|nr:aldehyde dehydrogenase family protein [Acidobacteriota bacterium]